MIGKEEKIYKLVIERFEKMPESMILMIGSNSYSGKDLIEEIKNKTENGKLVLKIYSKYIEQFEDTPAEKEFRKNFLKQ